MFGQYNVTNALAVYALAKHHNFDVNLAEAFKGFQGVKRRQELIGEPRGIQVIEDFAHHPTAVNSTLRSFQKRQDSGKLFAVFEPRSNTSRRNVFQEDYVQALKNCDQAFICRPFQGTSKLKESESMDVDQLVSDINGLGTKAQSFEKVEEILPLLAGQSQEGDTIVIMSNGGFQGIYSKLIKQLM